MPEQKSFEESKAELRQAEVDLVRAIAATPAARLFVRFVDWLARQLERKEEA